MRLEYLTSNNELIQTLSPSIIPNYTRYLLYYSNLAQDVQVYKEKFFDVI